MVGGNEGWEKGAVQSRNTIVPIAKPMSNVSHVNNERSGALRKVVRGMDGWDFTWALGSLCENEGMHGSFLDNDILLINTPFYSTNYTSVSQ